MNKSNQFRTAFQRLRESCFYTVLLLLAILCAPLHAAEPVPLTILHVADLHARLMPDADGRGGFARLATAIRNEKKITPNALVLDGGDLVQGTPVSTLFQGVPLFDVASLLGIHVMTLGNHEFDYGWEKIAIYRKRARFKMISANVLDKKGKPLADAPYHIQKVNGIRVAVIGVTTEDLPGLTFENALAGCRILPVVATTQQWVDRLKKRADLFVVLGHLTPNEEEALLQQATNVAVIVSGHRHVPERPPKVVDGRILVRTGSYGRELGRLDLKVDRAQGKVLSWDWKEIPITSDIRPDRNVEALVKHWEARVSAVVDVPIGTSNRSFNRSEVKLLMERAMMEKTGADFGFANLGGVRDSLPEGQVLIRHVWNIMPFDNQIAIARVKGSRLPAVVVGNRTIDPDREYTLVTSDFVAEQQERELKTTDLVFERKQGRLVRTVLEEWIRERRVLTETLLK